MCLRGSADIGNIAYMSMGGLISKGREWVLHA